MSGRACFVAAFADSRRVGNLLPTILTGNHLYSKIFVSFGSGGQASLHTLQLFNPELDLLDKGFFYWVLVCIFFKFLWANRMVNDSPTNPMPNTQ
ncbi:MAG: hypothetical protein U1F46_15770 [Marinagarivorans sp.]